MGGNAIKALGFQPVRLSTEALEILREKVQSELAELGFPHSAPIRYLPNKESHGDLDLLVDSVGRSVPKLSAEVGRTRNGHVTSIAYVINDQDVFQVDLINKARDMFEAALNYFNYGDIGMMLGQVAAGNRLLLGDKGLYFKRTINRKDNIFLTRDWEEILPLLGYSYEIFSQGFKTQEEIYEFVTSSPFFSPNFLEIGNLKHHRRVRQRKRPTFMKMLEWLKGREFSREKLSLEAIHSTFPFLQEKIEEAEEREREAARKRSLLNGYYVMSVLPLQGKPLGDFMSFLKKDFPYDHFESLSEEERLSLIKEKFKEYSQPHEH